MQHDVSTMMMVSSLPVDGANGLPCAPDGVRLAPSLFVDLPYTPALLLDAHFGAEITDHRKFAVACQDGFEWYFSAMWQPTEDKEEVFVERVYTWAEVEKQVMGDMMRRYDLSEVVFGAPSLPWRAGFVLGWLSGLALCDRGLALRGLELLKTVVHACQGEEGGRA